MQKKEKNGIIILIVSLGGIGMSLCIWLPLNGTLQNNGIYNITHSGTPVYGNGKIGKALDLLNSSQITINCSKLSNVSKFSICFWIKGIKDTNDSDWASPIHFTVNKTNGTENESFRFGKDNRASSDGYPINMFNNSAYSIATSNSLMFSTQDDWSSWIHVCFTTDGTNLKAYRNGVLYRSANNGTNGWLTGIIKIRSEKYNGLLNDFRVYDHVLSDKEVEEIAKGLVLHQKLDNNGLGGNNLALHTHDLNISSAKTNLNMYIRGAATRQLRLDGFYESKTTANWQGLSFWANQLNLSVGTKITYSFYIYGNGSTRAFSFYPMMYNSAGSRDTSTKLPISIDGGSYTTVNSKAFASTTAITPEYHYVTFEWNQAVANIISNGGSIELSIQVHGTWHDGDWACIFAPKIEIGDTPTPWSPAPEDIGINENIIYDSSGYNNNGNISSGNIELISSPRYSVGSSSLNAINTKITATLNGLSSILANGEKYTLACWVRPTGTNANGWVIQLGNNQCGLWWAKSEARWVWNENDNGKRCANPTISSDYTNWHHLVTTVDKTDSTTIIAKHYVDGQPAEGYISQIWNGSTFTQPTGDNITYFLQNSDLSDIRLYVTELTADQVAELYHTSASIDNKGNLYARELVEN